MRSALNAILSFIGASSLTDEEYELVGDFLIDDYQEVHDYLATVLASREGVSEMPARLSYYYLAKGIIISGSEVTAEAPKSNVFVGGVL